MNNSNFLNYKKKILKIFIKLFYDNLRIYSINQLFIYVC
jgi:hypothetical protein